MMYLCSVINNKSAGDTINTTYKNMRTKINASANEIFRNEKAVELYNKFVNDSNVYEYGVDCEGNIYFAFANGVIKRYPRREFLKIANDPELCPR